jgi:hypothetical protein
MDIHATPHAGTKVAIVQTGSWGDNINSTLMLAPIKAKYPDARIELHTSTYYASAFVNNPYIDKLLQYPSTDKLSSIKLCQRIAPALKGYDIILNPHPMYNPDKWSSALHPEWGSNLIYAWVRALENQGIEYTLPLQTVLKLTPEEVRHVDEFVATVDGFADRRKNLMEIEGESGQTFWDTGWTKYVVEKLCSRGEIVFISHRIGVPILAHKFPRSCFNVNILSIRECAELFNRCDKFFSVSSGLSNACNTNWCRTDVEWVEVIKHFHVASAPIRAEGKTFWYEPDLTKFLGTV